MAMNLPSDAQKRKEIPVYSGCVHYFPLALAAVSALSKQGNDQHNPGSHLHWDRSKSGDEKDAMMRHIIDEDWVHVAWRALANLQKEIENGYDPFELFDRKEEEGTDEDYLPIIPFSYEQWKTHERRSEWDYRTPEEYIREYGDVPDLRELYEEYLNSFKLSDVQPLNRYEP
jgi:hypothetical protein